MPLTVGTAGHIDHGKTWLVRALTGKDTDRLPEEKARGISIDLGYAPLDLPDGRRLSIVDVPGHKRFIHNMVAGASGIDLFLLVVDAAEGARPQTHEHLAIMKLLGIERGAHQSTGEFIELLYKTFIRFFVLENSNRQSLHVKLFDGSPTGFNLHGE